jgi:hypothetical protein
LLVDQKFQIQIISFIPNEIYSKFFNEDNSGLSSIDTLIFPMQPVIFEVCLPQIDNTKKQSIVIKGHLILK